MDFVLHYKQSVTSLSTYPPRIVYGIRMIFTLQLFYSCSKSCPLVIQVEANSGQWVNSLTRGLHSGLLCFYPCNFKGKKKQFSDKEILYIGLQINCLISLQKGRHFNPSLAGIKMNQACKRGYLYLRSHYPLNFTSIFMKFSRIICRS